MMIKRAVLASLSATVLLTACDRKPTEYKTMDIQTFGLEKENMFGQGVSIWGYITVADNLALLDLPPMGSTLVNLRELLLELRQILKTNCFMEQARRIAIVKGRVENVAIRSDTQIGIIAQEVELQKVQGRPFSKDTH
jgi:hypothetical protein